MKLPNFRLYDTQATTSAVIGVLALLILACLGVVVFKGINTQQWVIPYSERTGLSQYRPFLVNIGTALAVLAGVVAGIMGFVSLGQKRNTRQLHSWFGMALGAICVALAPVFFWAWRIMAESVLQAAEK